MQLHAVAHVKVEGGSASIYHQEHAPIALTEGTYRVRRQREKEPRDVALEIARHLSPSLSLAALMRRGGLCSESAFDSKTFYNQLDRNSGGSSQ
jgi:hypothetical protein